ncbi:hypothetical protein ScPMuIL_015015 [Solemya velum]
MHFGYNISVWQLLKVDEIPEILQALTPSCLNLSWKGGLVTAGGLPALAVFYLDKSDSRKLWAIGAGIFFTIYPWTSLVMMSDIQQAKKDDVIEKKGPGWTTKALEAWNRQHMYRSLAGLTAFGIFRDSYTLFTIR